jgi:hypothetical protein
MKSIFTETVKIIIALFVIVLVSHEILIIIGIETGLNFPRSQYSVTERILAFLLVFLLTSFIYFKRKKIQDCILNYLDS